VRRRQQSRGGDRTGGIELGHELTGGREQLQFELQSELQLEFEQQLQQFELQQLQLQQLEFQLQQFEFQLQQFEFQFQFELQRTRRPSPLISGAVRPRDRSRGRRPR